MTLLLCTSPDVASCKPVGQRVAYHETIEDCKAAVFEDVKEWAKSVPKHLFVTGHCAPKPVDLRGTI